MTQEQNQEQRTCAMCGVNWEGSCPLCEDCEDGNGVVWDDEEQWYFCACYYCGDDFTSDTPDKFCGFCAIRLNELLVKISRRGFSAMAHKLKPGLAGVDQLVESLRRQDEINGQKENKTMYIFETKWDVVQDGPDLGEGLLLPRLIHVADLWAPGVPDWLVDAAIGTMAANPRHTFLAVTAHPEAMRSYLQRAANRVGAGFEPLPNLWVGAPLRRGLPNILRECPAAVWCYTSTSDRGTTRAWARPGAKFFVIADWPEGWTPPTWTRPEAFDAGDIAGEELETGVVDL